MTRSHCISPIALIAGVCRDDSATKLQDYPAWDQIKSVVVANIFLGDIFRGSLPFIGIQLLALMLILFFPELKVLFR